MYIHFFFIYFNVILGYLLINFNMIFIFFSSSLGSHILTFCRGLSSQKVLRLHIFKNKWFLSIFRNFLVSKMGVKLGKCFYAMTKIALRILIFMIAYF